MSYTVSLGLVEADHWTGMASAIAALIDAREKKQAGIQVPVGQVAAATRFLNYVLDGIALDRRVRRSPNSPTMAGISNLTIAVQVLAAMPGNRSVEINDVEQLANVWLAELEMIGEPTEPHSDVSSTMIDLRAFLRELQRQGNLVRYRKLYVH